MKRKLIGKSLSLLLAVCLVCTLLLTPAMAAVTDEEAPVEDTYTITLPITVTVKQTGDVAPGEATFKFEPFDFLCETEYTIVSNTITTNGVGTFTGNLVFTVAGLDAVYGLTEGFCVRQVAGSEAGWTYSDAVWLVASEIIPVPMSDNAEDPAGDEGEEGLVAFFFPLENDEISGDPVESMQFTNSYNMEELDDVPKTGDNGVGIWVALLLLSGAALTATVVLGRKETDF